MIPVRRSIRALAGALLLASATVSLSTCSGIGGSEFAGGGTGGTGISTGSVSGFGSVVMNGVHYRTDGEVAPQFVTKKIYNGQGQQLQKGPGAVPGRDGRYCPARPGRQQRVGDRISGQSPGGHCGEGFRHGEPHRGPRPERRCGQRGALCPDTAKRHRGGQRIRGRRRPDPRTVSILPISPSVREFEVKGFVSGLSLPDATFRLGPLPDGSGASVTVSFGPASVSGLAGGLANGMYVDVATTDREPVGGIITATRIVKLAARTEFPDGTPVDLEGLVTTPWSGSVNDLSFAVEGKRVRWNDTTEFAGGGGTQEDTRQTNRRVQVQGTETGGVLSAARIVFR